MNTALVRNPNNDLTSSNLFVKLALFVLWPFGAFLVSLFRPGSKSSYVIYFLFGMVFSWSMYYKGEEIDFNNLVLRFYMQDEMTFSQLFERMSNIFSYNSEDKDVYNLLLNWITQQFTQNFHALFVIASIPFSYFMLKSLALITDDPKAYKQTFFVYVILLLFIVPKDIFNVQNFRFSTATWVAVYSVSCYYLKKNKKVLLLLFLTPLIHSSFWFVVILYIGYLLFNRFYHPNLFYVSIPFAIISTGILNNIDISILPDTLSKWASGYVSDEAQRKWGMNAEGSGFRWVQDAFTYFRIIIYSIAIIIILKSEELNKTIPQNKRIFNFHIYFLTIVYFCQSIPVLGSRFLGISQIVTILLWFKIIFPKHQRILLLMLLSWTHELLYAGIKHYSMVIDGDFFFLNLFSLISKYWGIVNY